MKNRQAAILLCITCVFLSFTLGFLAGRSTAPGDTIIMKQPEPAEDPVETQPVISDLPAEDFSEHAAVSSTEEIPEAAEEPETETSAAAEEPADSKLININTATLAQLDSLPGIGPVLAQRIIDYREAHGPFTALSQLMLVEGIGEKRLADMLPLITIE